MAWNSQIILICSLLLVLTTRGRNCAEDKGLQGDNQLPLAEKALHHYDQLINTLTQIHKNGLEGLPAILSAASNRNSLQADVTSIILKSFLSPCNKFENSGIGSSTNINIFNNASVHFSVKTTGKGEDSRPKEKLPKVAMTPKPKTTETGQFPELRVLPRAFKEPAVRPLNFELKRDGDDAVRITFEVLRTAEAWASHSRTYDGERKSLKGPEGYDLDAGTPIASRVDFVFNSSHCPPDMTSFGNSRKETFLFLEQKRDESDVRLTLPTCILDFIIYKEITDNDNEKRMIRNDGANNLSKYSQSMQYPDFWRELDILSVQTSPSENVAIDLGIYLCNKDYFTINAQFYNESSDSMIVSKPLYMSNNYGTFYSQEASGQDLVSILSLDNVNQTRINGSMPGTDAAVVSMPNQSCLRVSFRLTLMTGNDNLRGYLTLEHQYALPDSMAALTYSRRIRITPANQEKAFPKNKFIKHEKRDFVCGSPDLSSHMGFGDDCTFFCTIDGEGIKHMRVRNVKGGIPPVQKFSEIFSSRAYTFVNLGPTTKQQDGEYECRAVTYEGKKIKWRVTVRTWGFPEITEHRLNVTKDTSSFVCAGKADVMRPAEVFVYLTKDYANLKRIDHNGDVIRSVAQSGDETRMELTIPNDYLKWPMEAVVCQVQNDAGEASNSEYLISEEIPTYYYQTDHPYLVKDKSGYENHADGSTTFKCTFTGKAPLTMGFYINHVFEGNRIQNNSMNSIFQERVDDESIGTLEVPTSSLGYPMRSLYCAGRNSVGEDRADFKVPHVIHSNHSHFHSIGQK